MSNEYRALVGTSLVRGRAPLDPACCKAGVWSKETRSRYAQCSRKPAADGWCKQHHPEAAARRDAESKALYEKQMRSHVIGHCGERFMAALIKIRDGDNDPRATAAAALEGISYARLTPNQGNPA